MAMLSPHICSSGRRLPCAYLAELAANPTKVSMRSPLAARRALLVAALQVRIADAIHIGPLPPGTFGIAGELFPDVGGKTEFRPLNVSIFGGGDQFNLQHQVGLEALLERLPDSLLTQALRWAPPVLSCDAGDPITVVASQLLVAVHRYRYPRQALSGYSTIVRPQHHSTLQEVVLEVRSIFNDLVARHSALIAQTAASVDEARFLTGLGRTRVYELRQLSGRAA